MSRLYDFVIVGGGIAGLYTGYCLRQIVPDASFLIVESQDRVGGRVKVDKFGNTDVVVGAGIGRGNDRLLVKLMDQLEIKYKTFSSKFSYATNLERCDLMDLFNHLRTEYEKSPEQYVGLDFREFSKLFMGGDLYQKFRTCSGYTDYELRDVADVLYDYGFEHNFRPWTGLRIPWARLIDSLCHAIGKHRIQMDTDIIAIDRKEHGFVLSAKPKGGPKVSDSITCRRLVIATQITSLRRLLPHIGLYQHIHGQPFLRLYGQLSPRSNQILQTIIRGLTVVKPPLQKIIPIDFDRGIYMISYCDNHLALEMKKYMEDIPYNRRLLSRLIELSLDLPSGTIDMSSVRGYYWEIGTHYYEPLEKGDTRRSFIDRAQHPEPDILVVGEVVSQHQGWVQGALESVETGLTWEFISQS